MRRRHQYLHQRISDRLLHGDPAYGRLVHECFQGDAHGIGWVCSQYQSVADHPLGFVTWAKDQIETFADMFRRQVYAPTIEEGVAEECIRVTASHNRKVRDVYTKLSAY